MMKERVGSLPPFGLRIASDVRAWISEQAEKEDRSMNYVITKIIREKMEATNARATADSK